MNAKRTSHQTGPDQFASASCLYFPAVSRYLPAAGSTTDGPVWGDGMSAEPTSMKDDEETTLPPAHGADHWDDSVETANQTRVEEPVTGAEREGGLAKGDKDKEEERRESTTWPGGLPPSPPLTRSSLGGESREGVRADHDSPTVEGYASHSKVEDSDLEDEFEVEPRPRATVVRKASRIDFDAKLEPQPWDLVEPPATNNGGPATNGDYYASLSGRKYNTLSSARARTRIPKSSYYFGPPPSDSAYGTQPIGQIGLHHPREILRVERDYTGGELIQFAPIYPLELEGRITPTQFLESINEMNEVLISAHSLRHSFLDNMLAMLTLQLSRAIFTSHYEKEMRRLEALIRDLNVEVYNPVGLNILWPRRVAFLFMEIEYY
ncbi:Golgin subfamily A member 7/ERF4 family-domain-containing protein [Mycena amicta]|nr:Golgin subfamily A member 7/ERF4 family-domain-containing protein [Mycena amicta]